MNTAPVALILHLAPADFDPVTTRALRLEIQLPPDYSASPYEWEVE